VFWDVKVVQGVHIRVLGKLLKANIRSAEELSFEFRRSVPGGHTRIG